MLTGQLRFSHLKNIISDGPGPKPPTVPEFGDYFALLVILW